MATSITNGNAPTRKEDETHDLWLQWPFCMLLFSCFGSPDHLAGGAVFVQHDVYAHLHPALVQPHVARPADHWARNPELWSSSTTSRQTSAWFMRKSHHYDAPIIHLVKNVWDKDPSDRTISLNATFIILFKNPSHMSQISHLDKQVYLSGNGLLRAAYRDATTTRAHGYMVIDFHQAISEKFRLRSTLYSDEDFPEALACGPTSKPLTGRWTSNVGYKDHPGWWCLHLLPRTRHGSRALCSRILPPAARLPSLASPATAAVAGSQRQNHDCHCCGEEAPSSLRQGPSSWHEPLQPS